MPPPEFFRPLFQSFGYRLDIELGPPVTCRATLEKEIWIGTGATPEDAADKLVRSMFPSSLAWDLFLEALHGGGAPVQDSTQKLPTTPSAPSPAVRVEVVDAPLSTPRSILAEFEAAVPSIARSSPERMRLALLRRLCIARAAAAASHEATAEAQGVAARVLELAKTFWCGSAPGLRGDARPQDVGAVRRGWIPPTTWAEAADTARRALEDVDDRGLRAGLDAFGWADTASLDPPPPAPATLLVEVNAELDLLIGAGGAETNKSAPLRAKRLEAATRRVRWLRDAVDPLLWAATAGRVRRAVVEIGPDGEGAERLLDPTFRPPTSWATLDRFAPPPAADDQDDEDEDDEDEPEAVAPPAEVAKPKSKAKPASAAAPPKPAEAAPEPPPVPPSPTPSVPAPPPSSKAVASKRGGPEPPPVKGSPGELAGWALRMMGQLDTPEFLVLARPAFTELRNLGEGGIPTRDRRIKRIWREVLRRLG